MSRRSDSSDEFCAICGNIAEFICDNCGIPLCLIDASFGIRVLCEQCLDES